MRLGKYSAVVLIFLLSLPRIAYPACSWSGNTGTVAAPYAVADVQACVDDSSSKTGDVIVQIPNSTVTWSGTVTANMRSGFTNVTRLTITGQSTCSLNSSEITTGIPTSCGTNIDNMLFSYVGSPAKKFRFSNVRLTGNPSGTMLNIDGDSNYAAGGGWRIDHVFFDSVNPSVRPVWFTRSSISYGLSNGVLDHIHVSEPGKIFMQYAVEADGGNAEWMAPLGLGTINAVYIEDSKFHFTIANVSAPWTESQGGGRYVARHNVSHNGFFDAHDAIVIHKRGVRKYEVYSNTFTFDSNGPYESPLFNRGGSGVFFNNVYNDNGSFTNPRAAPKISVYRAESGNLGSNDPWNQLCTNNGSIKACLNTTGTYPTLCTVETDCGGTNGITNYCVVVDGSSASPAGYPCRDQLGVDQNSNGTQTAGAAPFLIWNNTLNGSTTIPLLITWGPTYMVDGRDYCLATDLVTMPSTCNGVTTTYTPYAYPHPLTTTTTINNIPYPRKMRIGAMRGRCR